MLRKLEKSDWVSYFRLLSKALGGRRAEVEVASRALGAQVVARWLPVIGITYDPRSDVIEISLEGLDHLVHRPCELYVDEPPFGGTSLGVIDGDAVLQIVTLRDPLMLPAPSVRG